MVFGRRNETLIHNGLPPGPAKVLAPQLNLPPRKLGSVIFGCTTVTMSECLSNQLFGLPFSHHSYVENIDKGMPLFLFNYTERKMYGIFEAASEGALYINNFAWTADSASRTSYPAQVRVRIRKKCNPLPESIFREAIGENYYSPTHFCFELNHSQTDVMLALFENLAGASCKPVVAKSLPPPSQPANPSSKVWKKAVGGVTSDPDDGVSKDKQPAGANEEWKRPPVYAALSKEVAVEAAAVPNNSCTVGDQVYGNDHEASITSYSQAKDNGRQDVNCSVDQSEVESHRAMPHGHQIQGNGVVATLPNGSENCVTESQISDRVLEKLIRLKAMKENSVQQVPDPPKVETAVSTAVGWEKLARDRCLQEQALLKEERDNLADVLSSLDTSVATTVKRNLELYASALAQMRQDGIELRRILDEAKMRSTVFERMQTANAVLENGQASLVSKMQALEIEVAGLRRLVESLQANNNKELPPQSDYQPESLLRQPAPIDWTLPEVYILGGLGEKLAGLDSVLVWSPKSDTQRSGARVKSPHPCGGASVLDGQIYVCGGGDGSVWSNTVERYDRKSDRWTSCSPMRTQRGSLAAVTVGDRIFAIGGGYEQMCFSEVESYEPHLGIWMPCTSMLEKRFCLAATELDGALYAIGGFDESQYLMSVERFDPREALWSRIAPMSVKRGSLSAAVLNGKIYAVGGFDNQGFLDLVETFDPRAGRWQQAPTMCCGRAYGAAVTVGDALYYMGGLAAEEGQVSELGKQDSPLQRFTEKSGWEALPPLFKGRRSCFGAVVL